MKNKKHAGGFGSIFSSLQFLKQEKTFINGTKALFRLNKKQGIDCPGCAWPDPKDPSYAEFCENGVKAIAAETTSKRITADFFKQYSIDELYSKSDFWLEQQGRLTQPMYKPLGSTHYQAIEWNDLFAKLHTKLKAIENPNRAVFYTSGRTSNEAAFLYQLLGRQLGTNNFPDCSNLCHESSGVALKESIGVGKGTVSLEDFEHADLIFVVGQNPATNHPRMLTDLQHAAKRGATIVSINPLKEVGLQSFIHPQDFKALLTGNATTISSHYIQVQVGGDFAFFLGMTKHLFELKEKGETAFDTDFINKQTEGFENLKNTITNLNWDDLVEECGIPKTTIEEIAQLYAKANATIFCWAMGITQHKHAVATIQQMTNLLLLKGNIGKKGAGVCPVRGHSNVQGDRTMGIHEKPPVAFLEALEKTFRFTPPTKHGYDAVNTIKAMDESMVDFFMGLGGNFVAATPDTNFTEAAIRKCKTTLHVSTKLNRSHLVTGEEAFILPCLGRTEIDTQNGIEQVVSVEDSMSMVHLSKGKNTPASKQLLSEAYIVASIAEGVFGNDTIAWNSFKTDYNLIREKISETISDFKGYNEKLKAPSGFFLGNSAAEWNWQTHNKKANFVAVPFAKNETYGAPFKLMTVRSHDQYNTTVYGLNDRYRGIKNERKVLFIHPDDLRQLNLAENDLVNIETKWHDNTTRLVKGFKLKSFDISKGCLAAYFPETNTLVPIDAVADKSNTPMSKFIPVSISKSTQSLNG